jgi:hypothetical protein
LQKREDQVSLFGYRCWEDRMKPDWRSSSAWLITTVVVAKPNIPWPWPW